MRRKGGGVQLTLSLRVTFEQGCLFERGGGNLVRVEVFTFREGVDRREGVFPACREVRWRRVGGCSKWERGARRLGVGGRRGRDHFTSSWGEGGATRALGKCAARCEGRGQVSYSS